MNSNMFKRVLGLQDPPNVSYDNAPHHDSDPTVVKWLSDVLPSRSQLGQYLIRLLPFTQWIRHYNFQWFLGDLVAGMGHGNFSLSISQPRRPLTVPGITVGAVVVPQSMGYAKLANLPVQYGLYTSFMGVLIYWFFATSKDITIGVSISYQPI